MDKKFTKKEIYNAVITIMAGGNTEIPADVIVDFCKNEIGMLEKKALKAKEKAAEKRAAGDELTELIKSVMSTEDYEIIADIATKVAEISEDEISVAKITYRLSQLVKNGLAENTDKKIPATEDRKARVIKAYRLIG